MDMFQQIYLVVESVGGGIGLVLWLGVDGSCQDGIGQMFICLHHVYWCRNKEESVDTRWRFGVNVSFIPYLFAAWRVKGIGESLFGAGLPSASSRVCLQLERYVYRSRVDLPKAETCGSIHKQIRCWNSRNCRIVRRGDRWNRWRKKGRCIFGTKRGVLAYQLMSWSDNWSRIHSNRMCLLLMQNTEENRQTWVQFWRRICVGITFAWRRWGKIRLTVLNVVVSTLEGHCRTSLFVLHSIGWMKFIFPCPNRLAPYEKSKSWVSEQWNLSLGAVVYEWLRRSIKLP